MLAVIFLFFGNAYGQGSNGSTSKKWAIGIGAGAVKPCVTDNSFSSLMYTGTGWSLNALAMYQGKRFIHELQLSISEASLSAGNTAYKNTLSHRYLAIDYLHLYRLPKKQDKKISVGLGGALNVLYSDKLYSEFVNRNSSYEFVPALAAAARMEYRFSDDPSAVSVKETLVLPLVSAVAYPGYREGNKFSISSMRLEGFASYFRVRNSLVLEKPLTSAQRISLAYSWDYYQLTKKTTIRQVVHRLSANYTYLF